VWIKEDSKKDPKTLNTVKPWPEPWFRKIQKKQQTNYRENGLARGRRGQVVVGAMVCDGPYSPTSLVFLWLFGFQTF